LSCSLLAGFGRCIFDVIGSYLAWQRPQATSSGGGGHTCASCYFLDAAPPQCSPRGRPGCVGLFWLRFVVVAFFGHAEGKQRSLFLTCRTPRIHLLRAAFVRLFNSLLNPLLLRIVEFCCAKLSHGSTHAHTFGVGA
jgi:hypothetical protein